MNTRTLAGRSTLSDSALWIGLGFLVTAVCLYLLPRPVYSQDVGYEIFTDSEITLNEVSEEGFYHSRNISMLCRDGQVRIVQNIDDAKFDGQLDYDLYLGIWQQAIGLGLPGIGDAPNENGFPGQSEFDYRFRDGDVSQEFSAYAVDYLTDTRYRQMARAIIALANRTFSDDPPPPPPQ